MTSRHQDQPAGEERDSNYLALAGRLAEVHGGRRQKAQPTVPVRLVVPAVTASVNGVDSFLEEWFSETAPAVPISVCLTDNFFRRSACAQRLRDDIHGLRLAKMAELRQTRGRIFLADSYGGCHRVELWGQVTGARP